MRHPVPFVTLLPAAFALTMALGFPEPPAAPSPFRLPAIFSDHMVLQSGAGDAIWGWAPAGTKVSVDFVDANNKAVASAQATADATGKWSAKLPAVATGTTGELHLSAAAQPPVVIHDVLVGEDWLCGGQSNMTYQIRAGNMPKESVAVSLQEATDAKGDIRYFQVAGVKATAPNDDVKGKWIVGNADTVGKCSAVGWNFAVALREKLHSPIGLIVSCVGGTPAEVWMPRADFETTKVAPDIEKRYQEEVTERYPARQRKFEEATAAWQAANPTPELQAQNIKTRPLAPEPAAIISQFYNGMIHGLVPYTMKGVIWFQADGNMTHPYEYGELITTLVKSWRNAWQSELPFYYVEMNNERDVPQVAPVQYNTLSVIREQQEAVLKLPGTDVACSIDLGLLVPEPHFPNKKPVGQRLALLAFNNVYGFPCEAHSPQYASYAVEGSKVRIKFKYADGLRVRGGGKTIGFAIRSATGEWVWADGVVEGNDIVLSSSEVPQPDAVRYAWALNPLISVENGAGLPLRPFRTDQASLK